MIYVLSLVSDLCTQFGILRTGVPKTCFKEVLNSIWDTRKFPIKMPRHFDLNTLLAFCLHTISDLHFWLTSWNIPWTKWKLLWPCPSEGFWCRAWIGYHPKERCSLISANWKASQISILDDMGFKTNMALSWIRVLRNVNGLFWSRPIGWRAMLAPKGKIFHAESVWPFHD